MANNCRTIAQTWVGLSQLDGAALQSALQAIYTPLLTPANLKQVRTNEFLVGPQDPSQLPSAWELREFHLGSDARLHQSLLPLQVDPMAATASSDFLTWAQANSDGLQRGTVTFPAQYQIPTGSEDGTRSRSATPTVSNLVNAADLRRLPHHRDQQRLRPRGRALPGHGTRRDLAVPRGRAAKARAPSRPRRLRHGQRRARRPPHALVTCAHAGRRRRAALHPRNRRRARRGGHAPRRSRRLARLLATRPRRRGRAGAATPFLLRPTRQRPLAARPGRRRRRRGNSTSPTSTPCACSSAAHR